MVGIGPHHNKAGRPSGGKRTPGGYRIGQHAWQNRFRFASASVVCSLSIPFNERPERPKTVNPFKRHSGILVLLTVAALAAGWLFQAHQNLRIWGDERSYILISNEHAANRELADRLVPGRMPRLWWPPLPYGVYSLFATGQHVEPAPHDDLYADPAVSAFARSLFRFNVGLFLGVGLLSYVLALQLGLGRPAATLAAGLVLANPRIWFFIQSFWPELLHLNLLLGALVAINAGLTGGRAWLLPIASVLLAFAALTKGIVVFYLLCLAPMLLLRGPGTPRARIGALLALVLPFMLLLELQKQHNLGIHGDRAIANNTWVNIEAGMRPDFDYPEYFAASESPPQRESLSRQRTLEYLATAPLAVVLQRGLDHYRHQLLGSSFFARGLDRERWANGAALEWLRPHVIRASQALFCIGGITALLQLLFGGSRQLVAAVFVLYYAAALLVVGFNARFLVQLLPLLTIFSLLGVTSAAAAAGAGWRRIP